MAPKGASASIRTRQTLCASQSLELCAAPKTHFIVRPGGTEAMPFLKISRIGLMSSVGLQGSPFHPIERDFSRVRRRAMWRHTRPVVSGAPTYAMRRIAARCSPEEIFIVRDLSTRSNSSTASSRARGPVHRGTNCGRLTPAVMRGGRKTQKVSQLGPWTRSEILEKRRRCSRLTGSAPTICTPNNWRDALHARARARLRQPSPLLRDFTAAAGRPPASHIRS
jgi:hypothetical protein